MIQYLPRNTDDRHLQWCNSTIFTAYIDDLNLFPTQKTADWRVDSVYTAGQENKCNQQMQEEGLMNTLPLEFNVFSAAVVSPGSCCCTQCVNKKQVFDFQHRPNDQEKIYARDIFTM